MELYMYIGERQPRVVAKTGHFPKKFQTLHSRGRKFQTVGIITDASPER